MGEHKGGYTRWDRIIPYFLSVVGIVSLFKEYLKACSDYSVFGSVFSRFAVLLEAFGTNTAFILSNA